MWLVRLSDGYIHTEGIRGLRSFLEGPNIDHRQLRLAGVYGSELEDLHALGTEETRARFESGYTYLLEDCSVDFAHLPCKAGAGIGVQSHNEDLTIEHIDLLPIGGTVDLDFSSNGGDCR